MIKKVKEAAGKVATRIAYGAAPEGGPRSLDQIELVRLDGSPLPAEELDGKVVLFVNVASKCGLTPQYEGLQALYDRYRDQGFTIVGAPSNQFLGQEPGTAEQIAEFCSLNYGVTFPLLEKQDVNGAGRSPLYQWLIGSEAGGGKDVSWNFEKFVADRHGKVVARFEPRVLPDDKRLIEVIEGAL